MRTIAVLPLASVAGRNASVKSTALVPISTLGWTETLVAVSATVATEVLVEIAVNDTCHLTNPRKCTRGDFERIFAEAI